MASVLVQCASLEFDRIGCLLEDGIGPVIHPHLHDPEGPFISTYEYLLSFVSEKMATSPALVIRYQQVRREIESFLEAHNDEGCLQGLYGLIHRDFDTHNVLFTESEDGAAPGLSGVINFEYAHTGPLYYLYEYPTCIRDAPCAKYLHPENRILRGHFVQALCDQLPRSPEARRLIITCMNFKNFLVDGFQRRFMSLREESESSMAALSAVYLISARADTGLVYSGQPDYELQILFSQLSQSIEACRGSL